MHILLLRVCRLRENWCRDGSTFLIAVCTVKRYDISEVKNATFKSVCYVTENIICSLVISETGYVYCAVRVESSNVQAKRSP